MMVFNPTSDWQEAIQFRQGQRVELKRQPGVVDTIAAYDPMMVPPISLENDPVPRYPEELRLIHWSITGASRGKHQQGKSSVPSLPIAQ